MSGFARPPVRAVVWRARKTLSLACLAGGGNPSLPVGVCASRYAYASAWAIPPSLHTHNDWITIMAITLTRNGVSTAVSLHPENTTRKAVTLHTRSVRTDKLAIKALGGAELTLPQIAAQFEAHWSLLRKQSGGNPECIFANAYSKAIVKECKAVLDAYGVRKGATTVALAK